MRQQEWAQVMTKNGLDRLFADLPLILTPEEVGELLRMNKAAIYRWLNDDYLPGHKIGNNWRILRDDLYEWMGQRSNAGASPVRSDAASLPDSDEEETPDP